MFETLKARLQQPRKVLNVFGDMNSFSLTAVADFSRRQIAPNPNAEKTYRNTGSNWLNEPAHSFRLEVAAGDAWIEELFSGHSSEKAGIQRSPDVVA